MMKSIINIGSQAVIKLLFSVVTLKVVAYYAGPSGMAVLGQLQSFLQMAGAGASSMTSTGVVKLISEGKQKEDKVLISSFLLLVMYTGVVFLIFLFFARFISRFFLDGEWFVALMVLPFAAMSLGVNSLYISYYNGRQDYRRYFQYSIVLSCITAAASVLCAFYFERTGAVYSVVVAPIMAGLLLSIIFGSWASKWPALTLEEFKPLARSLLQFSLMAMGSAIVVYGGQIYLRHFIADNVSADAAGIWYSATRLSDIYIGIASVLFSTILLPRYSAISDRMLKSEVLKMLGMAAIFALCMVCSVVFASGFIVRIIYGEAFDDASQILSLYVFGDALKAISWVFLYVLIAKQKTLLYLVYEVSSAVGYVVFCIVAYRHLNFAYVAFGYIAQAAVSLTLLVCWFFRFYSEAKQPAEVTHD